MRRSFSKKKATILIVLIIAVVVCVPVMSVFGRKNKNKASGETMQVISVWQIDGFEGGRGSRTQYLKKTADKFFKGQKVYVNVTTITATAARVNIENGVLPDMISYPAGFYGMESLINKKDFANKNWCNGVYCILCLEENCTFDDVNAENTVINAGKDNLTEVAVALCGLTGAKAEEPNNAYLSLLNGKCKYLFGTQRDAFRLKTRNVAFFVKPVTQFNDLYQNISILTADSGKYARCKDFADYLVGECDVSSLGLFNGRGECEEQLKLLMTAEFTTVLKCPCSQSYILELKEAAAKGDLNKIKTLLK